MKKKGVAAVRLLVADDEKELVSALCAILKHNQYVVDAVYSGVDALDYALTGDYDGVLLDIMMPGMDGLQVLKEMRAHGVGTPVLLLTAKSQVEDRVAGLDTGADDYLPKPFSMEELLARIRAMTRRQAEYVSDTLKYGGISLDRKSFTLQGPDGEVRLAGKEYQMLELLLANPGQLLSTELFLQRVWGYETQAEINVVWVYISNLRKRLATVGGGVEIRAARGLGYTLEGTE